MSGEDRNARESRTALRRLQHEMRTPLGQIIGYSEMLLEEARESSPSLVSDLEKIHRAADELLGVVDQTLKTDKKQKGSTEFRYRVAMKRTVMLHWGCMRWVERANELPDPDQLVQMLPKQNGKPVLSAHLRIGTRQPTLVCREIFMHHMTRWVFREVLPEGKGRHDAMIRDKARRVAEWVGTDPHFSHSDMWASVALSRIAGKFGVRQV